jgi:16S rRNA (uracil1498-N3)-methyltransferase
VSERSRVYIAPEQVEGDLVHFSGDGIRHVRTVLRLRDGDTLLATDGTGTEYLLRIASTPEGMGGIIERKESPRRESPLKITLVQAVPKKELMDLVVQKAVELGVSEIRPVLSARTVVSLKGPRQRAREERWERIMAAAVAQSGRTRMPRLRKVQTWDDFLKEPVDVDLKVMLCDGGGNRGLGEVLRAVKNPAGALVAVGPEGGWAAGEVEAARRAGLECAGLGPRTLRSETAGLVALSVLQFVCGDLGGEECFPEDSGNAPEDL